MRNSSTSLSRRRLRGRFLLSAVLSASALLCGQHARALDRNRPLSQFPSDSWASDAGFPGGTITSMAQTSDGYLWIGTDKGLIRFDGLKFSRFLQASPETFTIGPVRELATDSAGNLWVLLQNTKVLRWHAGRFEVGRDEAEVGLTAIGRENSGRVLLSSLAFGLLTFDGKKFQLSSVGRTKPANEAAKAAAYDTFSSNLSWATGVASHSLAEPESAVTSILETRDGSVWLGTRDRGLFYADGERIVSASAINLKPITCLLELSNREIWVGTEAGLFSWNGKELQRDGVPPQLRGSGIHAMLRDRDSGIWIATGQGLARYDEATGRLEIKEGESEEITALFQDREGDLWLGANGKLTRMRESPFSTFSPSALHAESVGPVFAGGDGSIWFAPLKGGLRRLKEGRVEAISTDGLDHDVIYSISGKGSELWIGRQRGGVTRLQIEAGKLSATRYTETNGLSQNSVYSVFTASDGSVWIATLSGGVQRFKDGKFTTYRTQDGLASDTVVSFAEANGAVWFATPRGLSSLRNGQWATLTSRDGLPDNITCLFTTAGDTLLIGTTSGLAFLQSGKFGSLSNAPESLRESVLGLGQSRDGTIWISTANHIVSVDEKKLMTGTLGEDDVRDFGPHDGLLGTQGVKRDRSVAVDSESRVWIATNGGLAVVDPQRIARLSAPVVVQIEEVSSDGDPVPFDHGAQVPAGKQRIVFTYSGLNLAVPERVRFRYKLDGFDKDWSAPLTSRTAEYTNLNPGEYRFNVIASKGDGVWSEASVLPMVIPRAWYQAAWFRSAISAGVLLLVWLAYQVRLRKLARDLSARFDERLAERTRIARELHDTLLQTVQGSKLVADDALDSLSDPAKTRRALERLSAWLARATNEGRAALNSLRVSTVQTNDLAEDLRGVKDELAVPSSMNISVSTAGKIREMHPVARDEVFRCGYEAILNACQHSNANTIQVNLAYADDLTLTVRDDGVGIDPKILTQGKRGHFGLQGMRERAARVGGKLSIASAPGAGTEVRLSVPGRNIFRPSSAAGHDGIAKS